MDARIASQAIEGVVHGRAPPLAEHTLRLLDHDPTRQRLFELGREYPAVLERSVLEDADRGHVGQRLGNDEIGIVEPRRSSGREG